MQTGRTVPPRRARRIAGEPERALSAGGPPGARRRGSGRASACRMSCAQAGGIPPKAGIKRGRTCRRRGSPRRSGGRDRSETARPGGEAALRSARGGMDASSEATALATARCRAGSRRREGSRAGVSLVRVSGVPRQPGGGDARSVETGTGARSVPRSGRVGGRSGRVQAEGRHREPPQAANRRRPRAGRRRPPAGRPAGGGGLRAGARPQRASGIRADARKEAPVRLRPRAPARRPAGA